MKESVAFTDLGIVSDTQPSRSISEHAEAATAESTSYQDSANIVPLPARPVDDMQADHFVEKDGMVFAGTHLIINL